MQCQLVTVYQFYSVDATRETGRLGRLVNHSATQANATVKVVQLKEEPYLCIFASRDILVGEELLIDYGERRKYILEALPWLKL